MRADPLQLGLELRPTSSLIDRAVAKLAAGPVDTPSLAADVLALRGNPRAAAAAVFALLGSDPRVRVDGAGIWSLAEANQRPSYLPLRLQEWVVVDVETTGGSPGHGHRIIEIAAVHVAGGAIRGSYTSLVNPYCSIPPFITSLTGIAPEMVAEAPSFAQIEPQVAKALRGKVFVGHNATFDWRFVSMELQRCSGRTLIGRRLCTLRLARRLVPHLRSRSLGSLAEHYGFAMDKHHRALDDALATARLLLRFLDDLEERGVTDWVSLESFFRIRPERRKRMAYPRSMDAA